MEQKTKRKLNITPYIWLIAPVAIVALFCIYPAIMAIIRSFMDWSPSSSKWVWFENYTELFSDKLFGKGFLNMSILMVFNMFFSNFMTLLLAELLFNFALKGVEKKFRYLFLLPALVPGMVNVLLWKNVILSGTEEGDVYKSVFSIFKSRVMWLITNLVATILAASVVKGFQEVIAQISVLAVLMPIVASMGGTTGNQTLAVVVRALATRELTSANTMRVIGKEFLVGLNNGLLFALLIGIITHFWFPDYQVVSVIIAIAMLVTLIIASLSGILVPLTLNKLKIDPAISSGVFLIAITDCGGFFVFLGLAKLFLV